MKHQVTRKSDHQKHNKVYDLLIWQAVTTVLVLLWNCTNSPRGLNTGRYHNEKVQCTIIQSKHVYNQEEKNYDVFNEFRQKGRI